MGMKFLTGIALNAGVLLMGACSGAYSPVEVTRTPSSPAAEIENARETLISYFDELYAGDYPSAASRFGGDLGVLVDWNPDVEPDNTGALLEAACARQLRCLPIRSIVYANQIIPSIFEFQVEFSNPDGSLFTLGPCCGATETEMPPVSQFECAVEKSDGEDYAVMCLPVYVP